MIIRAFWEEFRDVWQGKFQDDRYDLISFLEKEQVEIIDKRSKGGSLWIVGGNELEELIQRLEKEGKLKKEGITFCFAKKGSKSTKHRPAWYTKYI